MTLLHKLSSFQQFVAAWLLLPVIAVLNGLLRELIYCGLVGDATAHQISAILLSLIVCFYVIVLHSRIRLKNSAHAFLAGIVWAILTVAFEFILGTISGMSVTQQLSAYNILSGNLWSLVVITVMLAPPLLRTQKVIDLLGQH